MKLQFNLRAVTVISFLLVGSACSPQGPFGLDWNGSGTDGSGSYAGLSNDYEGAALQIIQTNCTSCHTATSGPANIYAVTDVAHLVSSGLVVPGEPTQSPLYTQINSGVMPPNGALSAADQQTVYDWILESSSNVPTTTLPPTTQPPTTTTQSPSPTTTTSPTSTPTFTQVEGILQANCVGCHSSGSASGGYALDSYSGVMRAVNTSNPSQSLIYVITNSGQMPPRGGLSAAQEQTILSWIQVGAKNN